jgi:hypothetical protein
MGGPEPVLSILTEDQVIDAVSVYLETQSWRIVSRATAIQHGDDLVAERRDERLVIEAKGAGSSKIGTARYGKTFSSGQVFDHVAKAVLKALRVVTEGSALAGIALPGDNAHRAEIARVGDALAQLQIAVFWVSTDRLVSVQSSWEP